MRDPQRITTMLDKFQLAWEKNPELRFGQIIEMIKRKSGKDDIFYIEDELIDKYLDEITKNK